MMQAETSTESNIRRNLERILKDNEIFLTTGEYQTRPDILKLTCDTAKRNGVISNNNYDRYINIIDKSMRLRTSCEKDNYIKDTEDIKKMIFWGK